MDARTYRVKNLSEALELIRQELGPDAALLHTRRVRRSSLGGWLGATELEVTAAANHSLPSRLDADFLAQCESLVQQELASEELASESETQSTDPFRAVDASPSSGLAAVKMGSDELAKPSIATDADQTQTSHPTSARPASAYARAANWYADPTVESEQDEASLTTSGVHQVDTDQLMPLSQTWSTVERLRFTGPLGWRSGRSHWVALVGPTGVGKTTTLAKIAAECRIERNLEVGLVSLDTYRVNGAAHLRTYADILQMPLEVVESPEQMREVAEALTERFDIVLLDTGGQGPRDHEQRRRLKALLDVAKPDEVLLTLSAASHAGAWRDAVDRFRILDPSSLIVTKLDEGPTEPWLVDAIEHSTLPLSYLTFGQQVPQDIALAAPQSAHDWIVAPSQSFAGPKQHWLREGA